MSNGILTPVSVAEDASEKKLHSEPDSLGSSSTDSDTDTESENEQESDADSDPEKNKVPSSHSPKLKIAKGEGLDKLAQEIRRIPTQPRTDEGLHIHHVM